MKRNDILIFHKFGNKRSEITFNGLAKLITDSKPSKIELSFKMSSEQSDFNSLNVSKLFVRLGNLLINAEQTIEIHVHNLNNLISGMAMGFLKVRFIVLIHKS
jgi:succinylglutamate desuccinylase